METQVSFPCRTTQRPSGGTTLCFSFLLITVDYLGLGAYSTFSNKACAASKTGMEHKIWGSVN